MDWGGQRRPLRRGHLTEPNKVREGVNLKTKQNINKVYRVLLNCSGILINEAGLIFPNLIDCQSPKNV